MPADVDLSAVNLRLVTDLDSALDLKRWMGERRDVLGVDTETGGFSPEKDRLRLGQFGDKCTGWAVPWERWSGLYLELFTKYEEPIVLHNSKFDARFIVKHGGIKWPWHRTHDTMTMAHLTDPLRSKGLKQLSAMLVNPQAAAAQKALHEAMHKHKWTWDTIPVDFPMYWAYAAMDPVLTCHVYDKLAPEALGMYKTVYDLEMGTTRVIAGMEAKGAKVNLAYAASKMHQLQDYCATVRTYLTEVYGPDIGKFTDMKLLNFFQSNGIPMLEKTTKSGTRQALDKEVLESIDHEVARYVLAVRKAEKTVGPYFSNFLDMADEDSRLHPNIWTMGTRTARMSITQPALQTLPRKDPTVRTAFVADEGSRLFTIDADQIEARLAAHFSNDVGMIEAFRRADEEGEDFFCTLAGTIFGMPIAKKDERRQLTKNTTYGKLYGAGAPKMAQTAGVPLAVMQGVVDGFDRMYPGILRLQREINFTARQRMASEGVAYIETPLGRRLAADDNKEYTLTNYLIQSHAAEILKQKIVHVDTVYPGVMRLPVHDELVFELPADEAVEMARGITEIMNQSEGYRVPITWSGDLIDEGKSWGSKYE